jgi:hypothetical protein
MGRGLAQRPTACVEHPHRPALDRCDDCGRRFCAECLVPVGGGLRCRGCEAALPARVAAAAEARRLGPRLQRAVRERAVGLALGGGLVGVLAAAVLLSATGQGTGGAGISQALRDEPAVLHRAAAERYCSGGGGTTGEVPQETGDAPPGRGPATFRAPTGAELPNVIGVLRDTRLRDDRLAATPGANDPTDPLRLIAYLNTPPLWWRSPTGLFPQQLGYELAAPVTLDRVAFRQAPEAPSDSWAKEVGLLLSGAPERGFYLVGRWTLAPSTEPQEFAFFETPARYVRVCLYGNYGHPEFVSLGIVALGVQTSDQWVGSRPLLVR